MTGAGIMLMSEDVPQGSVCTSNPVSDLIEQLQYGLGEGPCVDAYHEDEPVLEPDLAEPSRPRWPAFAGPAIDAGVRAVFGFPLRVGAVRLGALNLYCDRPGPLTDDQHADALVMADVAAQAVHSSANLDFVFRSTARPPAGARPRRRGDGARAAVGCDDLRRRLLSARRRQRALAGRRAAATTPLRAAWKCSPSPPARTVRSSHWRWASRSSAANSTPRWRCGERPCSATATSSTACSRTAGGCGSAPTPNGCAGRSG